MIVVVLPEPATAEIRRLSEEEVVAAKTASCMGDQRILYLQFKTGVVETADDF